MDKTKNRRFAQAWEELVNDPKIDGDVLKLYLMLQLSCDFKEVNGKKSRTDKATISIARLAEKLGWGKTKVNENANKLAALGLGERTGRRTDAKGKWKSNTWTVHDYPKTESDHDRDSNHGRVSGDEPWPENRENHDRNPERNHDRVSGDNLDVSNSKKTYLEVPEAEVSDFGSDELREDPDLAEPSRNEVVPISKEERWAQYEFEASRLIAIAFDRLNELERLGADPEDIAQLREDAVTFPNIINEDINEYLQVHRALRAALYIELEEEVAV